MQIDVNEFINNLEAPSDIESKAYFPTMKADSKEVFTKFQNKDSELPHTIMGRRILGHSYGPVIALKFKKWIFGNYPIGNAEGNYDSYTDTTKMLPA